MKFKQFIFSVLIVASLALSGCATSGPEHRGEDGLADPGDFRIAGRIASVNDEYGYVVLRCDIAPPMGAEAQVYRGGRTVATVRFTRISDYPYCSADIIAGAPRKGDLVAWIAK